jgi:hypothetical protein
VLEESRRLGRSGLPLLRMYFTRIFPLGETSCRCATAPSGKGVRDFGRAAGKGVAAGACVGCSETARLEDVDLTKRGT